jgi:hypothetical protein
MADWARRDGHAGLVFRVKATGSVRLSDTTPTVPIPAHDHNQAIPLWVDITGATGLAQTLPNYRNAMRWLRTIDRATTLMYDGSRPRGMSVKNNKRGRHTEDETTHTEDDGIQLANLGR